MHTARQLRAADFVIEAGGAPATRDDILPAWTPWDRLGVVVDRPFGALGANALIQLAITAFYDVRPRRRDGFPLPSRTMGDDAIYPEIYLFHVGGRHGFHGAYDFWPARKEVFVAAEPRRVLDAVNDRAITRLLVPDAPAREVRHEWKEPASARDRIASAFLYSPTGTVRDADVTLLSVRSAVQANAQQVLAGAEQTGNLQGRSEAGLDRSDDPELVRRQWSTHVRARGAEAGRHVPAARRLRRRLEQPDGVRETYRRITVDAALQRLCGVAVGPAGAG